uniref:Photosystem I reaction center subunit IX n=1 Tax=Pedinomonas tuberculata TaxID=160064 RepID=A0A097KL16_9CHLO|nr:subunit IX of photosystem I [Pedinomonas tuberculata]AIT93900.1 subunit IX of photosystem I [Pedinomonas tuberculata]
MDIYNKYISQFIFWDKTKTQIFFKKKEYLMKDFTTYLSTAPVMTIISVSFVASLLIEINRFFPDALIFAF